jgi:tetratricopeptide (TPR) repeat protein
VKLLAGEARRLDDSRLFFLLNRAFLVQKYDADRWVIHDLVANFCRGKIDDRLLVRAHQAIGRYLETLASEVSTPRSLHLMTRACRHFIATGQMEHVAAAILSKIASQLKKHGEYRQLIELIKPLFLKLTGRERWLNYHYAHCLFIVGELDDALNASENLLRCDLSDDATLRLAACRLYSEALGAAGNSQHGEIVLANAIRATELSKVRGVGARQALTALAGLEFQNGRIASAKTRLTQCLREAERSSDGHGMAIPLVWLGMIEFRNGSAESALAHFDKATRLFLDELDERGQAWAKTHAAEALIELGRQREAQSHLRSALEIYSDMGVRDRWLKEQLRRIVTRRDLDGELRDLVNEALGDLRQATRLHFSRTL